MNTLKAEGETKKEMSVYQQQQQSIEKMILQAINQGVPVETMERVLAMRTQLKQAYAKEQYDKAMSGFQSECPIIKRGKEGSKTKSGQVAFKYAPLEVIIKEVQELLRKYSLSYNFKPIKNEAGKITDVRCYATHIDGYSDYSEMPVTEGGGTSLMSGSQISAASITFAKRYAFCNIFGIVTEEEDDENKLPRDAQAHPNQIEDAKEKLNHCMNMGQLKATWDAFAKEIKANREVVELAKEIKSNIQNEDSQN